MKDSKVFGQTVLFCRKLPNLWLHEDRSLHSRPVSRAVRRVNMNALHRPTGKAVRTIVPPGARSDLAPTGKLRAAINFGNPVLAQKDPASGEPRGVSVDLARELGRRQG